MPPLTTAELLAKLSAARGAFARSAELHRDRPLIANTIQEPGQEPRHYLADSASHRARDDFLQGAGIMHPLLVALGVPLPEGPDETAASRWLAYLFRHYPPVWPHRHGRHDADPHPPTTDQIISVYPDVFSTSCTAVDELIEHVRQGSLPAKTAGPVATAAPDNSTQGPVPLSPVALAVWLALDHGKLVPALQANRAKALADIAGADDLREPARLVVLSRNAAGMAYLLDHHHLDDPPGTAGGPARQAPAAAAKLVVSGIRGALDGGIDVGSPWYWLGSLLAAVLRLDAFSCAAERLRRESPEPQLLEVRQAAAKEPLLRWLDLSGQADHVALNFARGRRQEVISALQASTRPDSPSAEVAPESRRDDHGAFHAASSLGDDPVTEIPLEALARRGFYIAGLIRRHRVASWPDLELLNASCDRLLVHLEPIRSAGDPGPTQKTPPPEMAGPEGTPDPAVWISSTELKDLCGLQTERVRAACNRKKWPSLLHRSMRWYRRTDIRAEWGEVAGDI